MAQELGKRNKIDVIPAQAGIQFCKAKHAKAKTLLPQSWLRHVDPSLRWDDIDFISLSQLLKCVRYTKFFLTLCLLFHTPLFAMMQPEDDPDVIATFEGYESCLSEDEDDADIPELSPDHQARDWGTVAFWVADIGCLAAIFVGLPVWAYLDQEARQRMMGMAP